MRWQHVIDTAAQYGARLGGAMILASAVLVSLEVVVRNLGINIRLHSFELTNYGFAVAVAFAFAYAVTQRAHIRIDVLYHLMPIGLRAILDLLALVLLAILSSGMAFYAWKVVAHSARLGARPNSTLDIPLSLPQGLWALGLTWFALVSSILTLRAVTQILRGRLATLHAEAGVRSEETNEARR